MRKSIYGRRTATEERNLEITRLWNTRNYTMDGLAKGFHMSRSAIAGVLARLREKGLVDAAVQHGKGGWWQQHKKLNPKLDKVLPYYSPPRHLASPKVRADHKGVLIAPALPSISLPGIGGALPMRNVLPVPKVPEKGLDIMSLKDGMCRYVLPGEGYHFCGAPVVEGTSWCPTHYRIVGDYRKCGDIMARKLKVYGL